MTAIDGVFGVDLFRYGWGGFGFGGLICRGYQCAHEQNEWSEDQFFHKFALQSERGGL
jgi:hypothetical protein